MFIATRRLFKNVYFTIFRRETSIVKSKHDMQEHWEKKMKYFMKTYEDIFGLTKLSEMQDKVIEIQTNLQSVQENRRKIQEEIKTVERKLKEMQEQLNKTPMMDDKYMPLFTQVRELFKEQEQLQNFLSLHDQTEREQQTALAMAINNSQKHENKYREGTKYLSFIACIVGAVLGVLGSRISYWNLRRDVQSFASGISDQYTELRKTVDKLIRVVSVDKMLHDSTLNPSDETGNILIDIKSYCNTVDENVRSLQNIINASSFNKSSNKSNPNDGHIEEKLGEFERNFTSKLDNHLYVNLSVVGSYTLFLALLFLYMTKSS